MNKIQNIHISFVGVVEESTQKTGAASQGSYSIDIQAGEDWVVTGRYRENDLCALELRRITKIEAKE